MSLLIDLGWEPFSGRDDCIGQKCESESGRRLKGLRKVDKRGAVGGLGIPFVRLNRCNLLNQM